LLGETRNQFKAGTAPATVTVSSNKTTVIFNYGKVLQMR